jgi:hypothetical protein
MLDGIDYRWRAPITDDQLCALTVSHGGRPEPGWWDRIRPHSLGWVTAHLADGALVGFVNLAWDGCRHAFLLDTRTRGDLQRRGIATRVVRLAAHHARLAGCQWLHVDFDGAAGLGDFYFQACGFRPTAAGLIHLPDWSGAPA